MKSSFILVALAVLSFSQAGFAAAQDASPGSQTTAQKTEQTEKPMTFTGMIIGVDTEDQTIVVTGADGEKTFDVSNVTISGAIEPGYTVHVTYTEKEGGLVASSIAGAKVSVKQSGPLMKKRGA